MYVYTKCNCKYFTCWWPGDYSCPLPPIVFTAKIFTQTWCSHFNSAQFISVDSSPPPKSGFLTFKFRKRLPKTFLSFLIFFLFFLQITIICHDWGSGLGLHWLHQNQQKVEGVVYFEGVIGVAKSLKSFPDISRDIFGSLRSEAGEEMVLKKNFFVERLLPNAILRELDPVEMDAYLEPFREVGESRRPTLTWPRQIPFRDTGPQNVVEIVDAYTKWLSESKDFPKMFIDGQPGFFSAGLRKQTKDWPYQRVVKVKGLHFLQEDAPIEIGDAVKDFMQSLPM